MQHKSSRSLDGSRAPAVSLLVQDWAPGIVLGEGKGRFGVIVGHRARGKFRHSAVRDLWLLEQMSRRERGH